MPGSGGDLQYPKQPIPFIMMSTLAARVQSDKKQQTGYSCTQGHSRLASRQAGAGPPMQACGRRSAQRMAAACSALPHNTFLLASRPPPAARPPYNVHTPQQAEEPRGSDKEGILHITTTTFPIKSSTAMPCRAFTRRCGKLGQPQSLPQLKMPLLPSLGERHLVAQQHSL